jgi:putative transcriptional regulator
VNSSANSPFFQGQFLVAMPELKGSFFDSAVIYMLEHDEQGAFGLVINQQLQITEGEVLEQFDANFNSAENPKPVINGGPVEPQQGFILHRPSNIEWQGLVKFNDAVHMTNSRDILMAKAQGADVQDYLIALGYSGWAAGQLEQEISDNAWLTVNTEPEPILSLPAEQRLKACLDKLGISYEQLSPDAGHS